MAGYLVAQQIRDQLTRRVIERASEECVAAASYELRVGSYRDSRFGDSVELKPGEGVVVQPGGLLLVGTYETVHFPTNLIGFLHLKSSYARRGLLSWSQGIVEPGYSGGLTIALNNSSNVYIPIVGGQKICHLVLSETDHDTDSPYAAEYQNSAGATPAKEGRTWNVVGDMLGKVTEGITSAVLKSG
ncbi:MAG TPA: dCTP deaminase [Stellaceae bacterium]|jgi:deoxycytidine triphosphate deaminase|nr:dCTP deaminase [Stellaceae bacterium]